MFNQFKAAPICVIGVSSHFDVVESLEKRVKSRFNHRQLVLLPPSSFEEYYKMVRDVLMVGEAHTDWNSSGILTSKFLVERTKNKRISGGSQQTNIRARAREVKKSLKFS